MKQCSETMCMSEAGGNTVLKVVSVNFTIPQRHIIVGSVLLAPLPGDINTPIQSY